jgi:hypothetical protein
MPVWSLSKVMLTVINWLVQVSARDPSCQSLCCNTYHQRHFSP